MIGVAKQKVPGGKLVCVKVDYSPERIQSVEITGDFFLYPEDSLLAIERALCNSAINLSEKQVSDMIEKIIKDEKADLIGVTPDAIASAMKQAIKR